MTYVDPDIFRQHSQSIGFVNLNSRKTKDSEEGGKMAVGPMPTDSLPPCIQRQTGSPLHVCPCKLPSLGNPSDSSPVPRRTHDRYLSICWVLHR